MKALKMFGVALMATMVVAGFTACSSDDDDDNGGGSSSAKKLKTCYTVDSDGDKDYEYENPVWKNGKIVQVTNYGDVMTIDYTSNTTANVKTSEEGSTEEATLNSMGFATELRGFTFTYNPAGQMTKWESDESGSCTLTYNSDGDLVRIKGTSGENVDAELKYTNSTVTSKIENKGGIMLFYDWQIMWDYEYVYWLGIYGNASKHLPVKVGDFTYTWTLDSDGYPTKCVTSGNPYGDGPTTYYFEWE